MNRRRLLLVLVKEAVADLGHPDPASLTYAGLQKLLAEKGLQHSFIDQGRFAAMVLSYARGHTTFEDV